MAIIQRKKKPTHYAPALDIIENLNADYLHQLSHRICALLQGGLLFCCELDFNDLFQAVRTELARHTDKKSLYAVFALKVDGARENFLFVLKNGFHHLCCSRRRRVISTASLQILYDFGTAVASALDDGNKTGLWDQFLCW